MAGPAEAASKRELPYSPRLLATMRLKEKPPLHSFLQVSRFLKVLKNNQPFLISFSFSYFRKVTGDATLKYANVATSKIQAEKRQIAKSSSNAQLNRSIIESILLTSI